jgi:RNA-directed DNA polymerase
MKETDSWIRMRLRSILRRRAGRRGRSRKRENIQWGNHYFQEHGLFSLLAARELEMANLRKGANL